MAKSKDNTILWVAALAAGGYLLWKHNQPPQVNTATTALPVASLPGPVLNLLPSPAINTSVPASSGANSAPNPNVVNTTNLQPALINPGNIPVLQPGQSLALNPNTGMPILSASGAPLVFTGMSPQNDPEVLEAQIAINNLRLMSGRDAGDCF